MNGWLAGLGVLALSSTGCFMFGGTPQTPLPEPDVQTLTTCKTGDLAVIKKNLMLAGYSIQNADDDTVVTDFKQTASGYGNGKEFLKITAVKVDDGTTKFKVRVKTESLDQVQTGEMKDGNGRTIATDSTLVQNQNETDEGYFQERRDQYVSTQKEVCGGGA